LDKFAPVQIIGLAGDFGRRNIRLLTDQHGVPPNPL
jgi:hypothetical protein